MLSDQALILSEKFCCLVSSEFLGILRVTPRVLHCLGWLGVVVEFSQDLELIEDHLNFIWSALFCAETKDVCCFVRYAEPAS